ncbi:MAG: hypothetical protein WCG04_03565 [Alphaproteobacteria bacterium]
MSFMHSHKLPLSVLAGITTVMLTMSPYTASWLGLVLGYFSVVPLFIIGLRYPLIYLIIATGVTSSFMGVIGGAAATSFLLLQGIPVFFVCLLASKRQNKKSVPANKILTILTAIVLLLMTLFFLWILAFKRTPIEVETTLWLKGVISEEAIVDKLKATISIIIPSIIGASWVITTAINALVAQGILSLMGESLRPFPSKNDFVSTYAWDWSFVFLAGAAVTLMKPFYPNLAAFGLNAMLLAAVPLIATGLRTFYLWLMQWQIAKFWFFMILFLMIVLVWPMLFIVGLGILEPLLKLYPRLSK